MRGRGDHGQIGSRHDGDGATGRDAEGCWGSGGDDGVWRRGAMEWSGGMGGVEGAGGGK